MTATRIASILLIFCLTIALLVMGEPLIIPFVFALLIWLIVRKIKQQLNRIPFVKRWFPAWVTNFILSAIIFSAFALTGRMLTTNIEHIAGSYHLYEDNLLMVTGQINKLFHIDIAGSLKDYAGSLNLSTALSAVFNSLQGILSNILMILLYLVFIFLEDSTFQLKITELFPRSERYERVMATLGRIEKSIANCIALKTFVNLLSAILAYVVLLFVGIDSPLFWAFLLFVLNFIPAIGNLIGTLFPACFALVQFGSFTPFFVILGIVGLIQFITGNVLEPKVMGNSLNISPLASILALAFWGALWGVTGMFLSVPITVIMILVFSEFPHTRPIAILLSEKGKLG